MAIAPSSQCNQQSISNKLAHLVNQRRLSRHSVSCVAARKIIRRQSWDLSANDVKNPNKKKANKLLQICMKASQVMETFDCLVRLTRSSRAKD